MERKTRLRGLGRSGKQMYLKPKPNLSLVTRKQARDRCRMNIEKPGGVGSSLFT